MLYNFEKLRFTLFYINSQFDQIENVNDVYLKIFKSEPSSITSNKVAQQKIAQSYISLDSSFLSTSIIIQNNRIDVMIDGNADSDPISLEKIDYFFTTTLESLLIYLPTNPIRIALGLMLNKTASNSNESVEIAKSFFPSLNSLENIGELGLRINQIQNIESIIANGIISINTVKQIKQKIEPGQAIFFQIPQAEMQDACLIEFDFNTQPESNLKDGDINNIFSIFKNKIFSYLEN